MKSEKERVEQEMTNEDIQTLVYFRGKLPVDPLELERENSQQPALLDEVGEWVSGVKALSKVAKEHVDFVKADLSLRIRKNPGSFGLTGKITEGSVDATITVSSEYQQAVGEYIEADKLANEASNLLLSVEQRKSSISNLVRLYVNNYYSSEKPISDEEWKESEAAIIAMRNRKAEEAGSSEEDSLEEE